MKKKKEKKIPLKWAIVYIVLSVLIVGTTGGIAFHKISSASAREKKDPTFNLLKLIQKNTGSERLPTKYLAELLGLSIDHPKNYHYYNVDEWEEKVRKNPLFRYAAVRKLKPNKVMIHYELREPIAFLGDFTNTAIDKDGALIPFKPFFKNRNLPIILMGLEKMEWGSFLKGGKMDEAFAIYRNLKQRGLNVKKIDVSKMYDLNYGRRQVVVEIQDNGQSFIRLNPNHFSEGMENYLLMRPYLKNNFPDSSIVIDMRLTDIAFIKPIK